MSLTTSASAATVVAEYLFTDGTFIDSQAPAANLTTTTAATFAADRFLSAGNNDAVLLNVGGTTKLNTDASVAKLNLGGDFSLSIWVKIDAGQTGTNLTFGLISKRAATGDPNGYELTYNPSTNVLTLSANAAGLTGTLTTTVDLNSEWHHIAATVSATASNQAFLYVDGIQAATTTFAAATPMADNTAALRIGVSAANVSFRGALDEARLYTGAVLTAGEILALAQDPPRNIFKGGGTTSGPTSANWNAAASWASGVVPTSGVATELYFFGSTGTAYTATNNFAGTFQANKLFLNPVATNHTINGSAGTIFQLVANGGVNPTINYNGGTQFLLRFPTINFANTVTILGSNNGFLQFGNHGSPDGVITGGVGADLIVGDRAASLFGPSTYQGNTFVSAGGSIVPGVDSTGGIDAAVTSGALGRGTLFMSGGLIRTTSNGSKTVNNSFTINGNITIGDTNANALTFAGTTTLTGNRTLTCSGASPNYRFTGAIVEDAAGRALTKAGASTLTFGGTTANTYTGLTSVTNGILILNKTAGVDAFGGNLTIGDGTGADTVRLSANDQFPTGVNVTMAANAVLDLATSNVSDSVNNLTMTGAAANTGTGTLTLGGDLAATSTATLPVTISGNLNIGTTSHDMTVSSGGALASDLDVTAAIANTTGSIQKLGTGVMTFAGVGSHSGGTTVSAGTLRVTGSLPNTSAVTVGATATLSGTGSVSSISSTGTVAPGIAASTAETLTATGSASLTGGAFVVDVIGGGASDVLVSNGATLGATLTANTSGTFTHGETFTIINNTVATSNPVVNTFATLPNGATFTAGGTTFTIRYDGGDGNDVVLIVNQAPAFTAATITQTVDESAPLADLAASDPETDAVTFAFVSGTLPAGVTGIAANGAFIGTPNLTSAGSTSATVRVTDAFGAIVTATLNVTVQDVTISITPLTTNVTEGVGATVTLNVTRTGSGTSTVTVNYAAVNGTALSGSDFTATSNMLSWTGTAPQVITVPIVDDSTREDNETFTVTLSGATNATIAVPTSTITIQDDDPIPTLSVDSVTLSEGNSGGTTFTFTASLSNPTTQAVGFNFSTSDGTATTADNDYVTASGTRSIAANGTSATFDVTVTGDTKFEGIETFGVTLGALSNATAGTLTGTGTINNDDTAPVLTITNASVAEGNSGTATLSFTVNLSAVSGLPASATFTTADGTATTADNDYVGATGTATVAAGATSTTVDITVNGDTKFEPAEALTVTLTSPSNASLGGAFQGTGTINNDDTAPTISIANTNAAEGDAGSSPLNFTVSLSNQASVPITISYVTANGTATAADNDYTAANTTLMIPANSSSTTLAVAMTGDTKRESDETLTVTISSPSIGTIGASTATGTINNDDPIPSISIDDVPVTEGNSGTVGAIFTVTLSNPSDQTISVNYATMNDTALSSSDYVAASNTLTFPPGAVSQTLTVMVNGDALLEANETYFVNLSGATNATIADGQGIGTINNDEPVPLVSITDVALAEGNAGTTSFIFTVSLSGATALDAFVDFATADGTAISTGVADYTANSGQLMIPSGQTSGTITVLVNGDVANEPNETFFVNLTNATNCAFGDNQALGTINNDDGPPTAAISDVTLAEGNAGTTNFVFTVTVSPASGQTVTIDYTTVDGTATVVGNDYVLTSGMLMLPPNTPTATITVPVNGDTLFENTEGFTVQLSNPSNVSIGDATGAGTITNDETPPTLSIANVTQAEGNGGTSSVVLTATLSAPSALTTTVDFATADGTAVVGGDFQANSGMITIPAFSLSATITIVAVADLLAEPDESLSVNFTNVANATLLTPSATITLQNDDTAPVAVADMATTDEEMPVTIPVLANDTGLVHPPIALDVTVQPLNGALMVNATDVVYTPALNFNGSDSFTYRITDSLGQSSTALVSITVNSVNDLPMAAGQTLNAIQDQAVPITLTGADPDGTPLTFTLVTPPAVGMLGGFTPISNSSASTAFIPPVGFIGSVFFTFNVSDGGAASPDATVTINFTQAPPRIFTVSPNIGPTSGGTAITIAGDAFVAGATVSIGGTLATNVAVVNKNTITAVTAASAPLSADVVVTNLDGQSDTLAGGFKYNGAPVAAPQSLTIPLGISTAITLAATDPNGDKIVAYFISTQPANGTLSGTGPEVVYTPNAGFTGADSFQFSASDGFLTSAPATVSLNVGLALISGPTATPNPAQALQTVTFTAITNVLNATYDWAFGDGITATGPSVQHAFPAAGVYKVILKVTDASGQSSLTATVDVTVGSIGNPGGPTGPQDNDGDGFSNELEVATGTDPSSAASTPLDNKPLGTPLTLTLGKVAVKLGFGGGKDSITASGELPIPANFAPAGKKVVVDVGGIVKTFTLDAKGSAKSGTDALKVKYKARKKVVSAQAGSFSLKLNGTDFDAKLSDEGMAGNENQTKNTTLRFTILFDGAVHQTDRVLLYKSKAGKSGSAK